MTHSPPAGSRGARRATRANAGDASRPLALHVADGPAGLRCRVVVALASSSPPRSYRPRSLCLQMDDRRARPSGCQATGRPSSAPDGHHCPDHAGRRQRCRPHPPQRLQQPPRRALCQGRPARGPPARLQDLRPHARAVAPYHLERRTGGLSRVIARGINGIETIVRFTILNTVPTVLEFLLAAAIIASQFDWTYLVVVAVDGRRSMSGSR